MSTSHDHFAEPSSRAVSAPHRAARWRACLLTMFALSALSACGAGCKRADEAWRASTLLTSTGEGPHVRLEVDRRVVDQQLSALLSQAPVAPWRPRSPLQGLTLPALHFKVKALAWELSQGGLATLNLTLGLHSTSGELLTLALQGSSPVQLDAQRQALTLRVRADQFKRASLRLGRGSRRALKAALKGWLPRPLASLISSSELTRATDALLKVISAESYDVLRAHVLKRIGALAELSWALPDVPLRRAHLSLTKHVWRLELDSELQGKALSSSATAKGPIKGAQLWISAPWLTEAARWGMERGALPKAFSVQGKPQEGGPARVRLSWASKDVARPLKAHLWASRESGAPVCLYGRVGLSPQLTISSKGALRFKATGEVEQVEGHPFAELAAELTGLAERQLSWHTRATLPSSINTAKGELSWTWRTATLRDERLHVRLEVSVPSTTRKRKGKGKKKGKGRARRRSKRGA